MKKSTRKILNYSIAIIVSLCCVCIVGAIGIASSGSFLSTPTPALRIPPLDISTIIVQTSSAAQTQTLIAAPLTSTPFIFDTPTMLPPITLAPTWTTIPTNTPLILATQILTQSIGGEICSCSGDTLNCKDFSTHAEAQACFDYCMSQGAGDIHKLDENNDLNPCESLR
jgi:hypothetical protein